MTPTARQLSGDAPPRHAPGRRGTPAEPTTAGYDSPENARRLKDAERHERNLYEHGRKRGRHEANPDAAGPAPAEPAHLSAEHQAIYDQGRADGTEEFEAERRQGAKDGRRKARKKATRTVRRTATRHVPVVAGAATQLWHVVVVSLVMVGLYLALTSAKGVSGALGGLNKAVSWLVSPTAVI